MKRFHPFAWSVVTLIAASISVEISVARAAAPTEGAILGQVRDLDTGQPVPGVTVVASGPEGDLSALTDAKGLYQFRALPIGSYTIRFRRGEVLVEREATVSVDKVMRVNMRLPALPDEVETVATAYSPPLIDVGSSRIGTTFGSDFIDGIPNPGADVASLIQKTPGGYNDSIAVSPGVSAPGLSLGGGTGADNSYYLEGLNVTALRDGLLGTNLNVAFLEEAEVMSAGYGAEYGGALGGVVNMVLKSGSNEWKGSAFSWVEPGGLAGTPQRILSRSSVLTGVTEPDYKTEMGLELGGPIIKNKLFIWGGYVPEIGRSHFAQYTDRLVDRNGDGIADSNPDGSPVVDPLYSRIIPGESTTQNYAGKLTWRPRPEHVFSLSLVGIRKDEEFMRGANMDLLAGMSHELTNRQDIIAHWQSAFFDRKWRIDASLGLHSEGYSRRSPYGDAESMNDVNWDNSPSLTQFNPILNGPCALRPGEDPSFQPCPAQEYQSGGYGVLRDVSASRWAGQIKSTNVFTAAGLHELKEGFDFEFNQYDDKVWNSGLDGSRGSVYVEPDGSVAVNSLYRLPYGTSVSSIDPTALSTAPYYQDSIEAKTTALNLGAFIQESYMPLPNLTVNVGLRWEAQRLTDYQDREALSIWKSFAPRIGVVYDPTKEGRAKVFAHYGQYYESIPMDLADKAFGGQGAVVSVYDPCSSPQSWRSCAPPVGAFSLTGDRLAVQPNIKGSYRNEIVVGGQLQRWSNLVVGASIIRSWLGRIIEDTGGSLVPDPTTGNQNGPSILSNITDPTWPKPERTYTALQLTASKRMAKNWFFAGSYTLSQTRGNYTGLYAADAGQLDPNLSTQYDVAQLMANRNGPLPNDRPHVVHLDGYYQFQWGRHSLSPGLSFFGESGQPITPLGYAPYEGQDETFILPRGSAGRTPFVTQFDLHLSYRAKLSNALSAEAFIDIFNVLNQKAVLTVDSTYTYDQVMPATSGTKLTQIPLADYDGQKCNGSNCPVGYASANPNYLRPTSYQAPISGRLGMRVRF